MRTCLSIRIVAFTDSKGTSVTYRKFDSYDKAVEFFRTMLLRNDVNTISTRKILELKKRLKANPLRKCLHSQKWYILK